VYIIVSYTHDQPHYRSSQKCIQYI